MILRIIILSFFALCSFQLPALANPSQYGTSGLLNLPTADTLDSANICVGIWGNCSKTKNNGTNTIIPVTITMGFATFWEIYGTYPNATLSNNDAAFSGRGTADAGMKFRMYGQRNSKLKIAADIHLSKHIDNDLLYSGVTDIGDSTTLRLISPGATSPMASPEMSFKAPERSPSIH